MPRYRSAVWQLWHSTRKISRPAAEVVGDQRALFAAGERHDLAVCENFARGVAADGFDVVSAAAKFASDRRRESFTAQARRARQSRRRVLGGLAFVEIDPLVDLSRICAVAGDRRLHEPDRHLQIGRNAQRRVTVVPVPLGVGRR